MTAELARALAEEAAYLKRGQSTHPLRSLDGLVHDSAEALAVAERLVGGRATAVERSLAAHLLAEFIDTASDADKKHAVGLLERSLRNSRDPHLQWAVADAGRLAYHPSAGALLLRLSDSANPMVRAKAAEGLAAVISSQTRHSAKPRERLIELTRDRQPNVRDAAVFGLAVLAINRHDVREALLARLPDTAGDVRDAAIWGLARLRDTRVLAFLIGALISEEVGRLIVDSVKEAAWRELHPYVERLEPWWDVDPALLREAIEKTREGPTVGEKASEQSALLALSVAMRKLREDELATRSKLSRRDADRWRNILVVAQAAAGALGVIAKLARTAGSHGIRIR